MPKFIIIKYAQYHSDGKAASGLSVHKTYTAIEAEITKSYYNSKEEAQPDLEKLIELNQSVGYGIVELDE